MATRTRKQMAAYMLANFKENSNAMGCENVPCTRCPFDTAPRNGCGFSIMKKGRPDIKTAEAIVAEATLAEESESKDEN